MGVVSVAFLVQGLCPALVGGGPKGIEIHVVVDNNPFRDGLKSPWGFSCVVMGTAKTILFDTGPPGPYLLDNMQKMGISPDEVEVVLLSHRHGDHTGGVEGFLKENPDADVYVPASFPGAFKRRMETAGARVHDVKSPRMICPGVYSTGEIGGTIKEQSLVIRTGKGNLVITGCAHPGIGRILRKSRDLLEGDLLLAMGGFHLMGRDRASLEKVVSGVKALGVKYVGPCHCSGQEARDLFRRVYKDHYIDIGVGKTLKVKDLE